MGFSEKPEEFIDNGARFRRAAACRPSGTGKTLLAKRIRRGGRPVPSISGSDFGGALLRHRRGPVRDLFEQAKKSALPFLQLMKSPPSAHRGAVMGVGHDEREQTLNQLLVEMDVFGSNDVVIIIASTTGPTSSIPPAPPRPLRPTESCRHARH